MAGLSRDERLRVAVSVCSGTFWPSPRRSRSRSRIFSLTILKTASALSIGPCSKKRSTCTSSGSDFDILFSCLWFARKGTSRSLTAHSRVESPARGVDALPSRCPGVGAGIRVLHATECRRPKQRLSDKPLDMKAGEHAVRLAFRPDAEYPRAVPALPVKRRPPFPPSECIDDPQQHALTPGPKTFKNATSKRACETPRTPAGVTLLRRLRRFV